MWQNPQFPADLVTFTEEILNEKFYLFVQCSFDRTKTYVLKNDFSGQHKIISMYSISDSYKVLQKVKT